MMDVAGLLAYSPYLTATLVGLLGGVHCLGMCGGIVGALSLSRPQQPPTHQPKKNAFTQQFNLQLAYNTGRITSYMVAGALAGSIGAILLSLGAFQQTKFWLQLIAALFMIALGLYLSGIWQGVAQIEKLGWHFWRRIEPLGRRFMPVNSIWQALPFGMIWGWLPCGLVYSVLTYSIAAGSAINGALIMLAFGLGTLPNLLLMGALASHLTRWMRKPWVKRSAGALVAGFGFLMLWRAFQLFGG